jgi:hypothetical protein
MANDELGWKERTFYDKLKILDKANRIFKSRTTGKWGVILQ